MPRWLVIALFIVVIVAFMAKHYSARSGTSSPVKPRMSTTAAVLTTGFPCEADYSISCTPDQYMVIAKRNCVEVEAAGDLCKIVGEGGPEPYAVHALRDSERALWVQQQNKEIAQAQREGYTCERHNDPSNDSYGYRCWLPGHEWDLES